MVMKKFIILFASSLVFISIISFIPSKEKKLNIQEIRIKTGDDSFKSYTVMNNSLLENSIIKVRAGMWDKSDKVFRMKIIPTDNHFNFCYQLFSYQINDGNTIIDKKPESEGEFISPSKKNSEFIDKDGYFEISPKKYENSSRYLLKISDCDKKSKGELIMKFLFK